MRGNDPQESPRWTGGGPASVPEICQPIRICSQRQIHVWAGALRFYPVCRKRHKALSCKLYSALDHKVKRA